MLADVLKGRGAAEGFWRNMTMVTALVGLRPTAALCPTFFLAISPCRPSASRYIPPGRPSMSDCGLPSDGQLIAKPARPRRNPEQRPVVQCSRVRHPRAKRASKSGRETSLGRNDHEDRQSRRVHGNVRPVAAGANRRPPPHRPTARPSSQPRRSARTIRPAPPTASRRPSPRPRRRRSRPATSPRWPTSSSTACRCSAPASPRPS